MDLDKIRQRFAGHDHATTEMPAALRNVSSALITELDVRADLRNGQEPFSRIMAAQSAVATGGVLRLRAIFEPVPLYGALARFGFSHWTNRLADDDWEVWFYRESEAAPLAVNTVSRASAVPPAADQITLDVRGLEPPEPMQRTLEALAQLPADASLIQINSRIPHFLLPALDERGFEYVLISEEAGAVTGLIRRKQ